MKKNLCIYLIILISSLLFSCKDIEQASSKYLIIGEIKNFKDTIVILEEFGLNDITYKASADVNSEGNFKFDIPLKAQYMYQLRIGAAVIPIIADGKEIIIKGTHPIFNDITITGSYGTNAILGFIKQVNQYNNEMGKVSQIYDSLSTIGANDSTLKFYSKNHRDKASQLKSFIVQFADTTSNPNLAMYAIRNLDPIKDFDQIEQIAKGFKKRFKNNTLADSFITILNESIVSLKGSGPKVGDIAPIFTLLSLEGDSLSLTALKGKYVLLDFWASWCPPCRKENPHIVKAYEDFKNKNFTILSVSIDKDQNKWKAAVQEDGMNWLHVNDPMEWQSSLVNIYGFDRIPTNYLINPQGRIIAKNIFQEELTNKLVEIFHTNSSSVAN